MFVNKGGITRARDKKRIFRNIFQKRDIRFNSSNSKFLQRSRHFTRRIRHIPSAANNLAEQ